MRRYRWLRGVAVCAALASGCVERRYVVTTDPPGAIVLRNGQALGQSPADDHFVYYGNYHFTLIHDGYETLQVDQKIPAPWYEYPVVDFISENLVPWKITDVRRFHYALQPLQQVRTDILLERAGGLRSRGQSLVPLAPAPVVGVPPSGGLEVPAEPPEGETPMAPR
jgi:hypothetical protein